MDPPRLTPFKPHKHLKEEFVSNLTGSSMLEIALLSAIVPALMLLRRCISGSSSIRDLLSALEVKPKKSDNVTVGFQFWMSWIITLGMDFLCVIVPVISIFTVLSEWTRACAIFLILVLILCIVAERSYADFFVLILTAMKSSYLHRP